MPKQMKYSMETFKLMMNRKFLILALIFLTRAKTPNQIDGNYQWALQPLSSVGSLLRRNLISIVYLIGSPIIERIVLKILNLQIV